MYTLTHCRYADTSYVYMERERGREADTTYVYMERERGREESGKYRG